MKPVLLFYVSDFSWKWIGWIASGETDDVPRKLTDPSLGSPA
jgi:hypothetical protein